MRWFTLLLVALLAVPVSADDKKDEKPKDDVKARIAQYLENGKAGVFFSETHDVKGGEIIRMFAVGRAPISTVLGAEEGVDIAQEKAEQAAKTAFVTFLNGKVAIRKTANEQVILTKEGEEAANGEGATREQGKKIEKRTKEFEETAGGLVRGLKLVAFESKSKEKVYVVVYRWEARTAAAAARADEKQNRPGDPGAKQKNKPNTDSKSIPDKKVIIDD